MAVEIQSYTFLSLEDNPTISDAHKRYLRGILRNIRISAENNEVVSSERMRRRLSHFAPVITEPAYINETYKRLWEGQYKKSGTRQMSHYLLNLMRGLENSWDNMNCLEVAIVFTLAQLKHYDEIEAAPYSFNYRGELSYGVVWRKDDLFGYGAFGGSATATIDQMRKLSPVFRVAESKGWL